MDKVQDDQPRFYSSKTAAERLGITDSQVRRLAKLHGIGAHFGRAWMFTETDLQHLKKRNTKRGPIPGRSMTRNTDET